MKIRRRPISLTRLSPIIAGTSASVIGHPARAHRQYMVLVCARVCKKAYCTDDKTLENFTHYWPSATSRPLRANSPAVLLHSRNNNNNIWRGTFFLSHSGRRVCRGRRHRRWGDHDHGGRSTAAGTVHSTQVSGRGRPRRRTHQTIGVLEEHRRRRRWFKRRWRQVGSASDAVAPNQVRVVGGRAASAAAPEAAVGHHQHTGLAQRAAEEDTGCREDDEQRGHGQAAAGRWVQRFSSSGRCRSWLVIVVITVAVNYCTRFCVFYFSGLRRRSPCVRVRVRIFLSFSHPNIARHRRS